MEKNQPFNSTTGIINDEKVITVDNLYKSFGDNDVLKGFNLDLKKGENLVVLGKSGSGKSVLIKCMVGLLYPDAGEVAVLGENISILDQFPRGRRGCGSG